MEKICMITGATSGIGRETARVLAGRGWHLILVGRNEEKAIKTVAEIEQETGNPNLSYLLADFSDLASIRQMVARFYEKHERLDVLVNNAGAFFLSRRENGDGREMTFAVNHLGYFLLTNLLLDTLKASTPARIVNVASSAHVGAKLDFDDLDTRERYKGFKAYGRSKLANILFTYELARRLEGTDVMVNALHPGFVATNIGNNNLPWIAPLIKLYVNRRAIPVEQGAETVIYLASSPEVEGVTGKYFVDCEAVSSSPVSYDEEAARRLWQVSEEMVS